MPFGLIIIISILAVWYGGLSYFALRRRADSDNYQL